MYGVEAGYSVVKLVNVSLSSGCVLVRRRVRVKEKINGLKK